MPPKQATPKEIEDLYESIPRLVQERNDFLLPQILDFVNTKKWMNIRPEYQRRLVWDRAKKSRFIESLLMNIPIPPIFLYEHELSRYEVMDGQQRLNTILEFYENDLKLTGLSSWSAINGLTRKRLPEKLRRAFDRRRISATVLLAESSDRSAEEATRLRQEVFERLNTGGLKLNAQELRNSMYAGRFNQLLLELAGSDLFDDIWEIPKYSEHYNQTTGHISPTLAQNSLFKRMTDCEIVLRFFAFRQPNRIRGSVKAVLDRCMSEYREISGDEAIELKQRFLGCLQTAHAIFGRHTFQLKKNNRWIHSQPLFDAVMIAIDRLSAQRGKLVAAKDTVREAIEAELGDEASYEVVIGRPNTAKAVKARIDLLHDLFGGCI